MQGIKKAHVSSRAVHFIPASSLPDWYLHVLKIVSACSPPKLLFKKISREKKVSGCERGVFPRLKKESLIFVRNLAMGFKAMRDAPSPSTLIEDVSDINDLEYQRNITQP